MNDGGMHETTSVDKWGLDESDEEVGLLKDAETQYEVDAERTRRGVLPRIDRSSR